MKKNRQPNNAKFIYFSLIVFALIFLVASFIFNNLFAPRHRSPQNSTRNRQPITDNPDYAIENTSDPFITRVIKK